MGQILNRVKFFVKSHWGIPKMENFLNHPEQDFDPDAELKRLIDDLSSSQRETNRSNVNTHSMTLEYAYEILGIKKNATIDVIKQAYKSCLKKYHPDLVANLGEELQILAKRKTQEINSAYEFLKKHHNF